MSNTRTGKVLDKQLCPNCAREGGDTSQDNLVIFDDGSFCFKCNKPGESAGTEDDAVKIADSRNPIKGGFEELKERGIRKETCEKFGVQVGQANGKVIIHNFYNQGILLDQKIRRDNNKGEQWWTLGSKTSRLFGMDRQKPTRKVPVIVTEGEYDALCIYQETGLPAVSITKGAAGSAKQLKENLEWLQQWKEVVLCFDNDEAGIKAVEDSVKVFETSKVRVARLPLKDANDMVLAGRGSELKKYLWDAELVRKPTMVCLRDIRDKVLVQPKMGKPWPWRTMTDITFGVRASEITIVVAAEGIGKTEFIKEIVAKHIEEGNNVGMFSLEQNTEDTGQRLAASYMNKPIYVPECPGWDEEEISKTLDKFDEHVYLFDTESGSLSLERLAINLKFLKNAYGVDLVVIDNLTALCAHPYIDGKRLTAERYVGEVMTKLQELTRQLKLHVIIAAHTNKDQIQVKRSMGSSNKAAEDILNRSVEEMNALVSPPGTTWETGRMPNTTHILGSGNTARLADHVVALARNKESEDDLERRTTLVKFLKTGRKNPNRTMNGFKLLYNYDTGKLEEI